MKKYFITLLFIILISNQSIFANEDFTSGGVEDLFKHTNTFENGFNGQKQITEEEFNKVYKEVKEKQDKKKNKKNKPLKGKEFNQEESGQFINETSEKNLLLSIPIYLLNGDGKEIPTGHYKIVGTKLNNKVYLDFYQSSSMVARVPAIETNNDFDEENINFVKILPYNEFRIKVIYGSMDFNAYTFINIKNPISD